MCRRTFGKYFKLLEFREKKLSLKGGATLKRLSGTGLHRITGKGILKTNVINDANIICEINVVLTPEALN